MMASVKPGITASFDVDPQRGFTALCPDELPVHNGHKIAQELNAQAQFAKYRIVSKDCHPPKAPWVADTADQIMTPVEGDFPGLDVKWPAHCVVGTEGNRLIPELPKEADYDLVIEKGKDPLHHPYGACYHDLAETQSTGVLEWLKRHNIEEVIVGGLATDFCVKNTVLQLRRAKFKVIVNLGACRGVGEESSAQALKTMEMAGAHLISGSSELVSA
jgi:nicotinamidase/pyrazinamidase